MSPFSIIRRRRNVEGEPLGDISLSRLLAPRRCVDRFDHVKAVVHGHAHRGTYEGRTPAGRRSTTSRNWSRPLIGKPYVVLEIAASFFAGIGVGVSSVSITYRRFTST